MNKYSLHITALKITHTYNFEGCLLIHDFIQWLAEVFFLYVLLLLLFSSLLQTPDINLILLKSRNTFFTSGSQIVCYIVILYNRKKVLLII